LERVKLATDPELDAHLADLDEVIGSRAICLQLGGKDPSESYWRQTEVTKVRFYLSSTDPWLLQMRLAQIYKYIAYFMARQGLLGPALEIFETSRGGYEDAIAGAMQQEFWHLDLAARTNLAWCECGRLQCLRAKAAFQGDKKLPADVASSLQALRVLANHMTDDSWSEFNEKWNTIRRDPAEDVACRDERLVSAAADLTKAILGFESRSAIVDLVIEVEGMVGIAEFRDERLVRLFEAARASLPELSWLNREDWRLLGSIIQLLMTLRDAPDEQLIYADTDRWLKEQALTSFEALDGHHRSEGAYGLACLTAILCEHEEDPDSRYVLATTESLREAIYYSRFFIGRARTDPDFGRLRSNADFRKLLEYPTSEASGSPFPTVSNAA